MITYLTLDWLNNLLININFINLILMRSNAAGALNYDITCINFTTQKKVSEILSLDN